MDPAAPWSSAHLRPTIGSAKSAPRAHHQRHAHELPHGIPHDRLLVADAGIWPATLRGAILPHGTARPPLSAAGTSLTHVLAVSRRRLGVSERLHPSDPERPEELPDVVHQQLRLLERREMATSRHFGPVPEVVARLGPPPGRSDDLGGERGHPDRHLDPARRRRSAPVCSAS